MRPLLQPGWAPALILGSLCVTALREMVGSEASGRFFMLVTAASHSALHSALRAAVGKSTLARLKVPMEIGGAVGAVSSWAAARKHLPAALLHASSHVFRKDGGVREISGLCAISLCTAASFATRRFHCPCSAKANLSRTLVLALTCSADPAASGGAGPSAPAGSWATGRSS